MEASVNESHLSALKSKHAELEQMLIKEANRPQPDDKLIHALKKQKLQIKDNIALQVAH